MPLSRRDLLKYAAAVPGALGLSALVAPPAAAKAASTTWMADMMQQIGDVPLCRVALPGTHDSGTYGMTTQSALDPYNEGARARVVNAVDGVAEQRKISARPLMLGWSALTVVMLLSGATPLLARKPVGRLLIVIGGGTNIAMLVVQAFFPASDAIADMAWPPLVVFPLATIVLALTPSTRRWCKSSL